MSRIDLPKYELSDELFKETLIQIIEESFINFHESIDRNPVVYIRDYLSDDEKNCLVIEFMSLCAPSDYRDGYQYEDMPVIKEKINNFFTKHINENKIYTLDEFSKISTFTLLLKVKNKK